MKISRRALLLGMGAAPLVLRAQRRPARPKLAAICTTYFKYSHAQHIVDRFLEGYGWNGTHHRPAMDLVSIYIDQVGDNDVSKTRFSEFPSMKLYPTIAEALTLGGSTLAVDGVVLIGEHGRYPRNEKRPDAVPALRVLPADREGLQGQRALGAGVQRQAPLVELGMGEGDVRHVAQHGIPVDGGVEPAGHVADAVARDAARRAHPGSRVRLLRRRGQLRLPRARNAAVHGGAPAGRRDGRQVAAGLSRRRVLEGAPGGCLAEGARRGGAVPEPHAEAGARRVQPHLSRRGRHADAGEGTRRPIATSTTTA